MGSIDPGSNPGSPTIELIFDMIFGKGKLTWLAFLITKSDMDVDDDE